MLKQKIASTISGAKRFSPLLIALFLGLTAAAMIWYYLRASEREMAENLQRGSKEKMVNVVVANQPLAGGLPLDPATLAVRQMPADFVHKSAILPDGIDQFVGRRLIVDVKPGETILTSFLGVETKNFSEQLELGVRAVTIPIDEVSSISGMLRAGDKIDFMFMMDGEAGDGGQVVVPLMQNVEVRATGQITAEEFAARRNRPAYSVERDPYAQQRYTTVTVAVPPTDAQRLILSQRMGKIIATLRSPKDQSTLDSGLNGASLKDLVASYARPLSRAQAIDELNNVPRKRSSTPAVEYIVGINGGGSEEKELSSMRELMEPVLRRAANGTASSANTTNDVTK